MPVAFDNYSAGGSGGGYVSSITRNWNHTLNKPGIIIVFAGMINESTTAETPTTATCNSVPMRSIVSTYAKDSDKTWRMRAWVSQNLPAGSASISVVQDNGSPDYQYLDMGAASYSGVSTVGKPVLKPDVVSGINVMCETKDAVFFGVYGNATTISPVNRGSSGWSHIGDRSSSGDFTFVNTAIGAVLITLRGTTNTSMSVTRYTSALR